VVKCSGVLQCSDGLSNKVSNIIRRLMDNMKLLLVCVLLRGQFQNQPPIGWLKKYKKENKTLLYGTVTYIPALLLHIVAIQI